jgi:hypothetical protein
MGHSSTLLQLSLCDRVPRDEGSAQGLTGYELHLDIISQGNVFLCLERGNSIDLCALNAAAYLVNIINHFYFCTFITNKIIATYIFSKL